MTVYNVVIVWPQMINSLHKQVFKKYIFILIYYLEFRDNHLTFFNINIRFL